MVRRSLERILTHYVIHHSPLFSSLIVVTFYGAHEGDLEKKTIFSDGSMKEERDFNPDFVSV